MPPKKNHPIKSQELTTQMTNEIDDSGSDEDCNDSEHLLTSTLKRLNIPKNMETKYFRLFCGIAIMFYIFAICWGLISS